MRVKARPLVSPRKNVNQASLTQDQKVLLVANMQKFGGGFVYRLAEAMIVADFHNFQRICDAFPEIVEKYLNWNGGCHSNKN